MPIYTDEKCNTLKDCVHWYQSTICSYWVVVVLAIHLSRSSVIHGAQEACLCTLCFDSAGSNCGALTGE